MCKAIRNVRARSPGRTSYTLCQKSLSLRIVGHDTVPGTEFTLQSDFVGVSQVKNWLFPPGGADEGFHQESLSLSGRGARVAGVLEVAVGLMGLAGQLPWPAALAIVVFGALILAATRINSLFEHSRACVALGLGAVSAALSPSTAGFGYLATAILLLAAPALVPLLPWQSMLMGAAVVAAAALGSHAGATAALAVAAIILTASLYEERHGSYRSFTGLFHASQESRDVQSRRSLNESSATMVHLSAALAHELSSPIGTVSSSIETLLMLSARQAKAPTAEQERLLALQADLGRSLQDSMARLKIIVNRIQRLCHLDEAVLQPANLNDLLREAAALVAPAGSNSIEFEWNLRPLPDLQCRPQQLTMVFWNVLLNATQAIDGDGHISISSAVQNARVEVRIEDDGRGIPSERLAHIFDPVFNVADSRVSTGNWSLFTSRQFIKNHGGDLRIKSLAGRGTTVTLYLPCSS